MTNLTPAQARELLFTPAKPSKYRNRKVWVDGILFDSKAEAKRWSALKAEEKAGRISCLMRQVSYTLVPGVRFAGVKRPTPALRYIADAVYVRDGKVVVEDTKGGPLTQAFKIKRHLMLAIHGIDVQIVRAK